MSSAATALTIVTALGCALNGGILFAFSSFVLPALGRLAPAEGIRAMQSINVVALTPVFMSAFVGTGVLCAALIVIAFTAGAAPTAYLVTGALAYILGVIGVTRAYNVPLNDVLERRDADAPGADDAWREYRRRWAVGNHVRSAAGVLAGGLMICGLVVG